MTSDLVQLILARATEASNIAANIEQAVAELSVTVDRRLTAIEEAMNLLSGWKTTAGSRRRDGHLHKQERAVVKA